MLVAVLPVYIERVPLYICVPCTYACTLPVNFVLFNSNLIRVCYYARVYGKDGFSAGELLLPISLLQVKGGDSVIQDISSVLPFQKNCIRING